MKIMSRITDQRINSTNIYVETSFGEYISFAERLIGNNMLQRKRVRTSKSVYSLLKHDLLEGCVIPPIVLAVNAEAGITKDITDDELLTYLQTNPENVLILDGLQRTYTLLDARQEALPDKLDEFLGYRLRLEIYIEINKFGVLYRMLTLNTGQTPMSARHQLEMLYNDMLGTEIEDVKLVPEVEGSANPDENQIVFKNAIEGFNSYLSRDELPMDRQQLLENIKMLENMSEENVQGDLFKEFLEVYIKFMNILRDKTDRYVLTQDDQEEYEIVSNPFGKKVTAVFSTSQAMTGFGAAIAVMRDKGILKDFGELLDIISNIDPEEKETEWFLAFLKRMDDIKNLSKKIGNAQRMYFKYFYRELFNSESDSYLNLKDAVESAYKKYNSQVN